MKSFKNAMWPAAFFLAATPLASAAEGWSNDVQSSLEQAQQENKDVLMDFTGSDWCGWCIKLKDEVFTQEAFESQAPEKFVLVELDFPQNKPQSDEVKAQNQAWAEKLSIQGYPTIVLTDATGKPYAQTGYQPGGAEAYMAHLDELRDRRVERDEAMAAAESAEGVEKARHLDAALEAVGPELAAQHYGDTIARIVELDPENEAGLKDKYASALQMTEIDAAMQGALSKLDTGDADGAVNQIDAVIAEYDPDGEMLMRMRALQAQIWMMQQRPTEALAALDQAIEAMPGSPMAEQLVAARAQLQAMAEAQAAPADGGGE